MSNDIDFKRRIGLDTSLACTYRTSRLYLGRVLLLFGKYERGVCKSNESESVSALCYELVFHHKWADAQFFMADVQFFGADAQFFRADAQFFAVGLL